MRAQIGSALSKHIKKLMDARRERRQEAIRLKNKQMQTPWMNLTTDPEEKLQEVIKENHEQSFHESSNNVSESGQIVVRSKRREGKIGRRKKSVSFDTEDDDAQKKDKSPDQLRMERARMILSKEIATKFSDQTLDEPMSQIDHVQRYELYR